MASRQARQAAIDKLYKKLGEPKNYPWMSNYPELHRWVHDHNGSCLSQDLVGEDFWEMWLIGKGTAIIVIRANRLGWDIYTACASTRVKETLRDAETRLGLTARWAQLLQLDLGLMTWDEWCAAFPCPVVEEEPCGTAFDTRPTAERAAENLEVETDRAWKVVQFGQKFYVVSVL